MPGSSPGKTGRVALHWWLGLESSVELCLLLFSEFVIPWHPRPSWCWKDCLPPLPLPEDELIPRVGRHLPCSSTPFIWKINNPYTIPKLPPFLDSYSWLLFSCSTHPRGRYQTTRENPVRQSLYKVFKLANPKSAQPALPIISCRNHIEGPCSVSLPPPASWCLPSGPHARHAHASCFQGFLPLWPSFPCLCVLPYLIKHMLHTFSKQSECVFTRMSKWVMLAFVQNILALASLCLYQLGLPQSVMAEFQEQAFQENQAEGHGFFMI